MLKKSAKAKGFQGSEIQDFETDVVVFWGGGDNFFVLLAWIHISLPLGENRDELTDVANDVNEAEHSSSKL